ncbi:glycosyltransferase [Paramicrobacterium agarici]|uniref:D-inositol-3-phosphate glycosyltransferase n=1 Tax=Paramicrobacterium agarici TaxID=630514 RepID=A0A2A9DUW6_9MICO|nr:glycosyltransferase [Microbacterium agarici]PFG29782.1 D-inositol-3-phosphate glycosyltransferase [Microbacterium agarici]
MSLRLALVSLHTSPNDDPGTGDVGGMNVAVRHTALALAELGHEVDVLTRRSSTTAPDAVEVAPRVTLRQLHAGPAERRVKGDHEEYIAEFGEAMRHLGPYDVIHSHHWFSGMAALELAHHDGIPHVQSFHSIAAAHTTPLSEGERPESPGRIAGEEHLAQHSDAIITVSDAERETVTARLGADPARVHTVAPGVDAAQFSPKTDAATSDAGYLLAAARLEPLKGLDLAIEALAQLPRDGRPDLVVSGGATTGFDDYPDELRSLAERLGVADRVHFIGPQSRDALADLLRGARIALVPSHSETFGLIALEAQACGTPVVASDAGGLREAIVDGKTGILVPVRQANAWAGTISALLRDPERCAQLGAAGRERALTFTWERTARATVNVYESLLGRAA